jgi:hypothetical protein
MNAIFLQVLTAAQYQDIHAKKMCAKGWPVRGRTTHPSDHPAHRFVLIPNLIHIAH